MLSVNYLLFFLSWNFVTGFNGFPSFDWIHKNNNGQEFSPFWKESHPGNAKRNQHRPQHSKENELMGHFLGELNKNRQRHQDSGQRPENFQFSPNKKLHPDAELIHPGRGNERGQEAEDFPFGSYPENPRGQEVEDIPFGPKPNRQKGQEVEEINFGGNPDYNKGQEPEDFHFGQHPIGQQVEEINFGGEPHGQVPEDFNFGQKPIGQQVEEINFGDQGQVPEDFQFGQKPVGQQVEDINFGEEPQGQVPEDINFGQKPIGQQIEDIKFGTTPKNEKPVGQKIEEINFGTTPKPPKTKKPKGKPEEKPRKNKKPKGQVEELNSGTTPKQLKTKKPKGPHTEEIKQTTPNTPKTHQTTPVGQEVEILNIATKPSKGQEIEDLPFSGKQENPEGQKVEEINFGSESRPEGCIDIPQPPRNSIIKCESQRKCEATCHDGYEFEEGKRQIDFHCRGNKWVLQGYPNTSTPTCKPVCLPPCQNNGVCVAPHQCECPKNFEGPQCQYHDKPCSNHPPMARNSNVHCNKSNCVVKCFEGYSFPDGSTSTVLVCKLGDWTLIKNDWSTLPDCQPLCDPPCVNGGTCLDFNKCQCPVAYAGPQCQYETDSCKGEKLNFNGFYQCNGDKERVTCMLSCPEGHVPDAPLASEYVCHYSTGKFLPEPVPKCHYGKDVEVLQFGENSNTIHGGFENFESIKLPSLPVPAEPIPGECNVWNGCHYKTFDGEVFNFDSDCSYTLVQDLVGNTFKINFEGTKCVTSVCTKTLRIFYQNKEYILHYKDKIPVFAVDGNVMRVPVQLDAFSVEQKREFIVISLHRIDVNLFWNVQDHLSIKLNANLWNKTGGLCGNFNNNPVDDLYSSEGYLASNLQVFVDRWKNIDIEDIFNCNSPPVVENSCTDKQEAVNYCEKVFSNQHFEECYKVPHLKSYKDACVWDICKCGKECACESIHEFIKQCRNYLSSKGLRDSTSSWRLIADCPVVCPPGKFYSMCGSSTEPSCGSLGTSQISKYSECVEGCFCPMGMVSYNHTCIKKEDCPCQWKKKEYANGESMKKDCNTCTCQNGEWMCTSQKCGAKCSLSGGSHYTTFDGKRYDFVGQCSYYLLKSDKYSIESSNLLCSGELSEIPDFSNTESSAYSPCTKSLTIRHKNEEIKLRKHKEVFVNGADVSALPIETHGTIIRLASSNFIVVTLPDGVEVWWDGNTNAYIHLPENYDYSVAGLCGTYNNNQKDDFITPEGDIEQSPIAFAEKWKVEETCNEMIDPLKPHPCETNAKNKILAEKYCKKLKEEVFAGCHQYVDVEPFYKNCLYDVCSCQTGAKSCFCPVFADYGTECSRQGIHIPWRNEIRTCGVHCSTGQIYQPCGNSCTRSCKDVALADGKCKTKCAEGCNCADGFTLSSNGQCIPIASCPCYYQKAKFKAGHEMIMETDKGSEFCTCENAKWSCRPATKLEIDRDYENSNVKCNEALHEEYTTCEPAEPKTCKNMHEKPAQTNRICFPGCVCKKGFVWDSIGKKCVNVTECPCHHGGRSYNDGEKIQEDCNTCTCNNGKWSCTERECASICTTWGDSHFKTFDGRVYDFQGSCEFVLTSGSLSEYDSFFISLEIVPCGSTGISCPKTVTIKVGPPHKEETVIFNKNNPSALPKGLERILVREAGIFIVAEVLDLGITVQWDKGTRVSVKADSKWKNRVKGLCGNFNNNDLDDFKTPSSGETSEVSPVVFADSWRLQTYCPESNPLLDACDYRPYRRSWAVEKCSILKSETFEPCHSEVPFEPYLERCIVDTCGCDEGGDCECLCTTIAAYAEECTIKGVPIKWRHQNLCAIQCDEPGSVYSPCVSTCPPKSCDNQFQQGALYQTCSEETCVEGCDKPHCPPGEVFVDSSSTKCIPMSSCKSACLTVNNVTYFEGDLMENDDCHSCYCSHHKKACIGQPCTTEQAPTSLTTQKVSTPATEKVITTVADEHPTTVAREITSVCPPGQVWDNCFIACDQVCHYLHSKIEMQKLCSYGDDCISGCRPVGYDCSPGMFLRDENSCVHKRDCPCTSFNGTQIKPGEVVEITECEKCQCINNEHECFSVCTASFLIHSTPPSHNYTRKQYTYNPGFDFGQEGNVTLIYLRTTPKPHLPAVYCPSNEYETLIQDFAKFTSSSHLDKSSTPENAKMSGSKEGWLAGVDNGDQFLQVDLGRIEPVYAVNVAGTSGKYVTGYHLLYSLNGHKFLDVFNSDGEKEMFGGPFDGQHSVKQVLPSPIEAKYIRFHPVSWHEGIGMKVDVLGCKESSPSTTTLPVFTIPSLCNTPIGVGQKHYPKLKISASSSKPQAGPKQISFDNDKGWQPLTNSKAEWIEINFNDFVNFTGITTKGVPHGNDLKTTSTDSWVERYKVTYSGDDQTWNPILDDFGNEMVFVGNVDAETEHKNYFKRPIHAKALKIFPVKWNQNIAMRLDVLGCYEAPSLLVEATLPPEPKTNCSVCKGASINSENCPCKTENEWWDGEKCISQSECPCFVGLIAYPVGTTFTTEKCEECVCRLYGIPHCTPKVCDDCPPGLQKVVTPLCGCTCKPCEEHTRLCPTSNICLEESAWCNGIQDCPDDEVNCTTPAPTIPSTPKPCQPTCPPGYKIVYQIAGPSEAEDLLETRSHNLKTKKTVKTYKGSRKTKKRPKPAKLMECPPYDCVPIEEVNPTECPDPECPIDYLVIYKETAALEGACPLYACEPVPEFANCTVESKNIKTFDGTEYKYDICDHVLARDDHGVWNVSMFKTCGFTSCDSSLLIHHDGHSIELHPHNRTIKFDSFPFTDHQVELLNAKTNDFSINTIGNSMSFTSYAFGFEVIADTSGNAKTVVVSKYKGHLNGLCGLYNGHPGDDKTLPDGKLSKTTVDFGNSWFNPGAKECVEAVCPIEKQNIALEICSILKKEPFNTCDKEVNMEHCIEDVCNCLHANKSEEECRCNKLSDFAAKCKSPDMFGWRVDHDCPTSCPPNLVYYDCYPYACEPTCVNKDECSEPASECYSGCFCPDGMIKQGDQCIKVQQCRDCVCSGLGDSTYLTFDGALTFNGNCTYLATREKNPSGNPKFEVFITNNLCKDNDFMTCTEKIEIELISHSIKLIALPNTMKGVQILVDDKEQNPKSLKSIKEWAKIELNAATSTVKVDLPKEHLAISFMYKRFAFTISLPSHYYSEKVEGLCGTCAENVKLENMATPEMWQTDKDANCLIVPPTTCTSTPEHEKMCYIMNDTSIFGQCLAFVDPAPFIDQCLETLCLNGHICSSVETFSQACRDIGICINWRSDDFCPYTCPSDLEYQPCKDGCTVTCENIEELEGTCLNPPVEGCFCPNNEILVNGTCKPQKFCKFCDEEGGHYEGEIWAVDKCSNCTCNDKVVTCNKVECPIIDIECKEDHILVMDEDDKTCCPKPKCVCKPREQCPEVELPNTVLPVGMEAVVNDSGCCPKVDIVCNRDSCPKPTPCRNHYIEKIINTTNCCPEQICEKPTNLCIYEHVASGKKTGKKKVEVVKEVGDEWTDGPCKTCKCVDKDGISEAECTVTECSSLENHPDFNEYLLEHVMNLDKCCPDVIRKSCKHNGRVYKVGDSWMPDESKPCETMKCNQAGDLVIKETRMQFCNKECDKGWTYEEVEGECCGKCVQIGCVIDDKIYKDGEVWTSEDICANNTCIKTDGRFSISTMMEVCPSVEDCAKEDLYKDNCCLKCKLKPVDKKICMPQALPAEATVNLIREKKPKHGLCQNLLPLQNFTQCAGNCDSHTEYDPENNQHKNICKCCQPEEYSLVVVGLTCEDGIEIKKTITVPSKCNCMSCGG